MIGTKIYKNFVENTNGGLGFFDYDEELYFECAMWCNEAQLATIADKGDYYEVVEIPAPSLEELKEEKKAAFKAARNAEEIAPIEWGGNLFDYDADSRDRMSIKRRNIEDNGGTGTVKWTLADNTHTVIGLADFIGINNAASDRSESLHYKYNILKAQTEAATTKEELESIVW